MCLGTFSRLRRSLATSTLYAAVRILAERFYFTGKQFPVKKDSHRSAALLRRRVFLLWGVVKTIYIMYWGVFTLIIVPFSHSKVCTNFTKVAHAFLYTLYSTFFPFSKKTFSLGSIPPLSQLQPQLRSGIMLQIHLFQSFLFSKKKVC